MALHCGFVSERDAELKRKARELLSQFTYAHQEQGREATPEEGRQKELRDRAKQILAQVTSEASCDRPSTLPRGLSPFNSSTPSSRGQTPDHSMHFILFGAWLVFAAIRMFSCCNNRSYKALTAQALVFKPFSPSTLCPLYVILISLLIVTYVAGLSCDGLGSYGLTVVALNSFRRYTSNE